MIRSGDVVILVVVFTIGLLLFGPAPQEAPLADGPGHPTPTDAITSKAAINTTTFGGDACYLNGEVDVSQNERVVIEAVRNDTGEVWHTASYLTDSAYFTPRYENGTLVTVYAVDLWTSRTRVLSQFETGPNCTVTHTGMAE